ncbi:MAG: hypothetical protein Q9M32_07240 [Sulfurimonas sp.]|nr:hypothetical protein [Sulfurimonas sp.]
MNKNLPYVKLLLASSDQDKMLDNAQKISYNLCTSEFPILNILDYKYSPKKAIEELGVDLELMNQLIDDFVIQIVKESTTFNEFLEELQDLQTYTKNLDYTILRELAHKNLGVARNLRIEDSEKLLEIIMKENNLEYILKAVECLLSRVILLRPEQAYKTIRLIQVKSSF